MNYSVFKSLKILFYFYYSLIIKIIIFCLNIQFCQNVHFKFWNIIKKNRESLYLIFEPQGNFKNIHFH